MRPHKELSEKLNKIKNGITAGFVRSPLNSNEYNDEIKTLLNNITNYLDNHQGKPEDIKNQTDNNTRLWTESLSRIRSQYSSLYSAYTRLIDEEKIINRIETRAHLRALLFRFLTTLAIGTGVMLTYYFAHIWGIPMPLSRSLVSGL